MSAPRVAICDYGVGNLRSVERALLHAGADVVLTGEARTMRECAGVVLPGVGAFGAAADALDGTGLGDVVVDVARSGTPLLGVCLGHQLLFEHSDENGGRRGLGLLPGRIVRLGPERGKVPHMGWNQLTFTRDTALTSGIAGGAYVYFVHSYAATPDTTDSDAVVATADYGGPLVAVCVRDNVWSTQFHPEKSGETGLRIYSNFVALCARMRAAA
ncbi:MAG TPA: imidazole glycerol phosphate synthase subunit HisH [Candidatus Dormibacteraeota bacterium]|nr:imidazole glycerol phosphate synthase subunit HisH [Candidatus Dormibacteraeota bacterium]